MFFAREDLKDKMFLVVMEGLVFWQIEILVALVEFSFLSYVREAQGENESLRAYIKRFNDATLKMDDLDVKFAHNAFIRGCRQRHIRYAR